MATRKPTLTRKSPRRTTATRSYDPLALQQPHYAPEAVSMPSSDTRSRTLANDVGDDVGDDGGGEEGADDSDVEDPVDSLTQSTLVPDHLKYALEVDDEDIDVEMFTRNHAPADFVDVIEPGACTLEKDDDDDVDAVEAGQSEDDILTQHSHDDNSFLPVHNAHHRAHLRNLPEHLHIDDSELAFFNLFLSNELLEKMVKYSNTYADLSREFKKCTKGAQRFDHISRCELLRFFSVLIYRGLFPCSRIEDYWCKDPNMPQHPDFGITLFRFQQIKRFFKVNDPVEETRLKAEGKWAYYDKVKDFLEDFVKASQKYYVPARDVSIDEMIVRFGGRSSHTVKIRSKPAPVGYKILALCDHGYVYAVLPESRGQGNRELNLPHKWTLHDKEIQDSGIPIPKLTTVGRKVRHLVEQLPFSLGYKFNLYMDNFFNSVHLFQYLRLHGVGACGTARVHKNGPLRLLYPLKTNTKLKRGEFRTFHNGKVGAHFWVDSNAVVALSTIHDASQKNALTIKLRKRPRDTSTKGGKQVGEVWADDDGNAMYVKELPIPKAIDDYNQHMGGVDIADQLRQHYTVQMRSLRNWFPLFLWLLDSCIINAYIMRCLFFGNKEKNSHRLYRVALYQQLLRKAESLKQEERFGDDGVKTRGRKKDLERQPQRPSKRAAYVTKNHREMPLPEVRLVGMHFPEKSNSRHCYWCRRQGDMVRARQTLTMCSQCKVHLCTYDCFREYHTAKE